MRVYTSTIDISTPNGEATGSAIPACLVVSWYTWAFHFPPSSPSSTLSWSCPFEKSNTRPQDVTAFTVTSASIRNPPANVRVRVESSSLLSVNDVSRMGSAHGCGPTAAALHIKADKTANRISAVWCHVVGWRGWGGVGGGNTEKIEKKYCSLRFSIYSNTTNPGGVKSKVGFETVRTDYGNAKGVVQLCTPAAALL